MFVCAHAPPRGTTKGVTIPWHPACAEEENDVGANDHDERYCFYHRNAVHDHRYYGRRERGSDHACKCSTARERGDDN